MKKPSLKSMQKVTIVTLSALALSVTVTLASIGFEMADNLKYQTTQTNKSNINYSTYKHNPSNKQESVQKPQNAYEELLQLRQTKLPVTIKSVKGVKYNYVDEQDVLELSTQFARVLEDYYKSCDAGNWTTDEDFWPEDIDYIVTAIAKQESSYRTNIVNDRGCEGLTGIDKNIVLDTLRDEWFVQHIWKTKIPKVDCTMEGVDFYNPTMSIEYTYHYLGYNMANRFKKDKYFTDDDGARRCIWNKLEYSEEIQNRLLIASYFWGIDNVTKSVFGRPNNQEVIVPIEDYIYSDYVEQVLDKTHQLKQDYNKSISLR